MMRRALLLLVLAAVLALGLIVVMGAANAATTGTVRAWEASGATGYLLSPQDRGEEGVVVSMCFAPPT